MPGAWPDDGYLVLSGLALADAVTRYDAERAAAHDRLLVRAPGEEHPGPAGRDGAGAVDPHVVAPAARDLLLGPAVVTALTEALGAPPLLLDSAEAAAGAPDDGWHRDATFTGLADDDAALAVVVSALGDAEITVLPGSQHAPAARFSGRYRAVNPERDGADALPRHREELAAAVAGLAPVTVRLAAGEVALLHGDLVHEPVRGAALVGHASAEHVAPRWFAYRTERARRAPHGAAWFASRHYDLEDATTHTRQGAVPPPDAQAEPEPAPAPDVQRVEEGLAHPGSPPPRRSGGLVGTVRGLMGRRPPSR